MEKKYFVCQTKHTQDEEYAIIAQNLLIKQYCEDVFGMDVFKISRDKAYHPIILTIERDTIYAHTLAIWDETKELVPFQIGKLSFDNKFLEESQTQVESVGIHKAFMGKGVGTILLKAIEDLAHSENKSMITLDSLRDFVDLSGNNLTCEQVFSLFPQKEASEYVMKNFYDRNLYFYSTLGYVNIYNNYTFIAPLKKTNIESVQLAFGFTRPTSIFECKDKFRITTKFSNIEEQMKKNFTSSPLFTISKNILNSEGISPLIIKPTTKDLTNLDIVLTRLNFFKALYTDRLVKIPENNLTHSTKYSETSKLADQLRAQKTQVPTLILPTHLLYKKCQGALKTILDNENEKQ